VGRGSLIATLDGAGGYLPHDRSLIGSNAYLLVDDQAAEIGTTCCSLSLAAINESDRARGEKAIRDAKAGTGEPVNDPEVLVRSSFARLCVSEAKAVLPAPSKR